jgi:hypothetical protein
MNVALGELKRRIIQRHQDMADETLFVDPEDIDLWAQVSRNHLPREIRLYAKYVAITLTRPSSGAC